MAAEILRDPDTIHNIQHDLESFFYVLLYICGRYKGPNWQVADIMPEYIQSWLTSDKHEQLGEAKSEMLSSTDETFKANYTDYFTDYFKPLACHMNNIRRLIASGKATHGNFIRILRDLISSLPAEGVAAVNGHDLQRNGLFGEPSSYVNANADDYDLRVVTSILDDPKKRRRCGKLKTAEEGDFPHAFLLSR